jgi:hypothetical protein
VFLGQRIPQRLRLQLSIDAKQQTCQPRRTA